MPTTRTLGVIPARLASTRLPRKVLREIAGKPMLAWVYEAARACPQLDEVVVATDSEEVASLCRENGWPCELTSPDLPSGNEPAFDCKEIIFSVETTIHKKPHSAFYIADICRDGAAWTWATAEPATARWGALQ